MKDKLEILNRLTKLKENFDSGLIPQMHQHEVNPGLDKNDRLNYIYFTLPVSLNFQRSSPAMWKSALETYEDHETNFVFYPEKVVERSFEDMQKALVKHKLALLKNKHTEIWMRISKALFDHYNSDPREIIKSGKNDVTRIKDIIQKEQKKLFPYLSGAKMTNYWLYILHHFTDIKLEGLNQISIIPDTHVLQCSISLGLCTEKDSRDKVAEIWFDLLNGTEFIPIDFHPILWNWSRNNFQPSV